MTKKVIHLIDAEYKMYRIYNRMLTQKEIDEIYKDPYALYEQPLTLFWKRLFYSIKNLFS